jgi:hypothetical protein
MSHPALSYGDKGKYVEELQTLLNQKLKAEDRAFYSEDIKVNGVFNEHTKEFVKNFQLSAYLKKDGKVGKKTWAALLGTEMYNCFDIPAPFVAAPNQYQCWAGATAMLLGQGSANTNRPVGVNFEQLAGGGIGGLDNSHANMKKFAYAHYIEMLEGENLSCVQICNLVYNFGRLMLNIKGVNSNMKASSPNDSHLLILAGLRGDGTSGGTTVTLYNPSGGMERTIVESFQYLKSKYPKLTYQCFYILNNFSQPIY